MAIVKRCECGRGLDKAGRRAAWAKCEHQYFYRFKPRGGGGRRLEEATGEARPRAAEAWGREHRVELERAIAAAGTLAPEPAPDRLTIWALLALDRSETIAKGGRGGKGVAPGTLRGLDYAHEAIRSFWTADERPDAITYDRVIRYLEYRRKPGREVERVYTTKTGREVRRLHKLKAASGHTLVRELQVLARLVDAAAGKGWCAPRVRWPRVSKGDPDAQRRGRVHALAVVHAYLERLPTNPLHEALIAMVTGWREGTLHRLRPEYLEPAPAGATEPAWIRIPGDAMKGRKELYAPVPPEAFAVLQYRIQAGLLAKDGRFFPTKNYRRAQAKARAAIGYDDTITLRDLRTTYASAIDDPHAAMHLLSHKDLRTTAVYSRAAREKLSAAALGAASALAPQVGVRAGGTPNPPALPAAANADANQGVEWSQDRDSNPRPADYESNAQRPGGGGERIFAALAPGQASFLALGPAPSHGRGYAGGYAGGLAEALLWGAPL